ncbi:integrase core domain-containing protein [Oligosphaera ethanolica]|uniref:Integrase catalytic domain-containing protein n=1 Tax=Oligosphaera ethanolica TaxID=760260 RepID=A0AAE4AQX2_9BACT|nr:integrase core domain-containing protein [Oligosphaera ethanolica]MDQ0291583.1 hypothetical protein [Oligosphaera ethanolica]
MAGGPCRVLPIGESKFWHHPLTAITFTQSPSLKEHQDAKIEVPDQSQSPSHAPPLSRWRAAILNLRGPARAAGRDVEAVFQQGVERFPEAKGRVISNNGKQFVCKKYRELLTLSGFTYCITSPYYPQSNGKQERFHGSLKSERLNHKHLNDFDYAEKVIDDYVDYYNNVRLHSAIGYVTPRDMLEGRAPAIQALRSQKLKDARERRRMAFQEYNVSLTAHCETEDGSAGGCNSQKWVTPMQPGH